METISKKLSIRLFIPEPFKRIFDCPVNITVDGFFTATLPEDISKIFIEKGITLDINRKGRRGFFDSNTLNGLKKKIEDKISELCSEEEISREKVIRYSVETACSYSFVHGQFWPTCCFGQENGNGWRDGTIERNSTHRGPYGLWIYAEPLEKVVFRFKATGFTRTEYHPLREQTFMPPDSDLQWLSTLASIEESDDMKVKEVPLTDETLNFFVSLFKSLFALNEKIKPFLDPEGIQKLAYNLSLDSKNSLKLLE